MDRQRHNESMMIQEGSDDWEDIEKLRQEYYKQEKIEGIPSSQNGDVDTTNLAHNNGIGINTRSNNGFGSIRDNNNCIGTTRDHNIGIAPTRDNNNGFGTTRDHNNGIGSTGDNNGIRSIRDNGIFDSMR